MFYAAVSCANEREGEGGGLEADGEIIEIEKIQSHDFFERVKDNEICDSKILVSIDTLKKEIACNKDRISEYGVGYEFNGSDNPNDTQIWLRSGNIANIKNVPIWVNSENSLMEMDQFVGRSISATIRSHGAKKNEFSELQIDMIGDALRKEYYKRGSVRVGDILITSPGELRRPPHNVKEIFHVATCEGKVGVEVNTNLEDIGPCVQAVLKKAHERNSRTFTLMQSNQRRSIIIPMFGAGKGKCEFQDVFNKTVEAIIDFVKDTDDTSLRQIHLIAHKEDEFEIARKILDENIKLTILPRLPEV